MLAGLAAAAPASATAEGHLPLSACCACSVALVVREGEEEEPEGEELKPESMAPILPLMLSTLHLGWGREAGDGRHTRRICGGAVVWWRMQGKVDLIAPMRCPYCYNPAANWPPTRNMPKLSWTHVESPLGSAFKMFQDLRRQLCTIVTWSCANGHASMRMGAQ